MKISKIKITNYRLLKNFSIDLENILSLVIGKNNCGKTSFLSLLERFLIKSESNQFTFDDFNLDFQKEIMDLIESNEDLPLNSVFGINLKIYIDYEEKDNLSNINAIMLDLDPDLRTVILSFEYSLKPEKLIELRNGYQNFKSKYVNLSLIDFLKRNHQSYFTIKKKALEYNNELNFKELDKNIIDKIICFERIKAKRDVNNEDGTSKRSDKTLSRMSSKYYDKISDNDAEDDNLIALQQELIRTDKNLNKVYDGIFKNIVDKIKRFGGIKENESIIKIISSLKERNILAENTTVMYDYNSNEQFLPEDYNGLGYMNLIALIFEIEVLLNEFKKKKKKNISPADLNLLFIEEPEAHTHPQMQYVFIKNIKEFLENANTGRDEDKIKFNLQTVITTHSSHIVSESNFDDIKYFCKKNTSEVEVKNLKALQEGYKQDNPKNYQFLKQYLTINRAELFFADKVIFIEGDTERLLLPAIMKKLDNEHKDDDLIPLLSQNISMIEVVAYSQIFEKFIEFLNIKSLIITDIDSSFEKIKTDENDKPIKNQDNTNKMTSSPCRVKDANITKNSSLNFFYSQTEFSLLKIQDFSCKIFSKSADQWINNKDGKLCVIYQIEEKGYHARSFEDTFIHINREFICSNKDNFYGLKNKSNFDDKTIDAFDLAKECIGNNNKTSFALDILFHSNENYANWDIPEYIKQGLLWLKQ